MGKRSLLPVLFEMRFCRLLGVGARVRTVARRGMSVVCCFLVVASVVMFGGFAMVLRSVGVVFGCLGVMLRSFLRHRISSSA
jgi:hypothetical protein